mmetsp:Transcript_18950/g.57055  ORF Transcript_18950/g.57055 Transcript_18950/m.57055 type:complete len:90 (-) Transcript_18950:446-715(-)
MVGAKRVLRDSFAKAAVEECSIMITLTMGTNDSLAAAGEKIEKVNSRHKNKYVCKASTASQAQKMMAPQTASTRRLRGQAQSTYPPATG